jgi:hypothetical protein
VCTMYGGPDGARPPPRTPIQGRSKRQTREQWGDGCAFFLLSGGDFCHCVTNCPLLSGC